MTVYAFHSGLPISEQSLSPSRSMLHKMTVSPSSRNTKLGFLRSTMKQIFRIGLKIPNSPSQTVQSIKFEQLTKLSKTQTSVVKLGHAGVLMKRDNEFWLIDPLLENKQSFPFFNKTSSTSMNHLPVITRSEMPPIAKVLLTHNHRDHFDKKTIASIHAITEQFLVPQGLRKDLLELGVDPFKIKEFDCWQTEKDTNSLVTAVPCQHDSPHTFGQRSKTQATGWVIQSHQERIFISGDTGYSNHFKDLAARYGSFDLAIIEATAFNKHKPEQHLSAKQVIQAHIDLNAKRLLPVHFGSLESNHQWKEELEIIAALSNDYWIDLITPRFGEVLTLSDHVTLENARENFWWRDSEPPKNKQY